MLIVYSDAHKGHDGNVELYRGKLLPCFESPQRIELVRSHLEQMSSCRTIAPRDFGLQPILRIHDAAYLEFLQHAHAEWKDAGGQNDALPHAWIGRRMQATIPSNIFGKLGYYAFDAGTPITATTWQAALESANVALAAQEHVQATGEMAFGLTRPPGHHAASDEYGGYCFLNNAAIAAQAFLDGGAKRVGIIDVDFHHGNGTQSIFYDRSDVFFMSLHGDPADEYPYFLGYENERGESEGQGFTRNFPLPPGTDWPTYRSSLIEALAAMAEFRPDFMVVSLGVDTFEHDPISNFMLQSDDFISLGRELSGIGVPTVFLMEGGYATAELGVNVCNVLAGFEYSS